jgi:hypothetical protein
MKFQVGDPVYVMSTGEEGVISEFIGKDMAVVKVGTKPFHAFLSDLDHPYFRWFTQKKKTGKLPEVSSILPEKGSKRERVLPMGLYLLFFPEFQFDGFDEVVQRVKVFLLNETIGTVNFSYACQGKNGRIFSLDGDLRSGGDIYLHDLDFESASQHPRFEYSFTDPSDPRREAEGEWGLKPKRFFQKMDELRYANKAMFEHLLVEKLAERPRLEVVKPDLLTRKTEVLPQSAFDFRQARHQGSREVDLHIEKLCPDHNGMKASEILEIQLRACQKALDLAHATQQQALVLIHGVGKGSLRQEIHRLLDQTIWVKKYVHGYDNRYGYGATEVFFRS